MSRYIWNVFDLTTNNQRRNICSTQAMKCILRYFSQIRFIGFYMSLCDVALTMSLLIRFVNRFYLLFIFLCTLHTAHCTHQNPIEFETFDGVRSGHCIVVSLLFLNYLSKYFRKLKIISSHDRIVSTKIERMWIGKTNLE